MIGLQLLYGSMMEAVVIIGDGRGHRIKARYVNQPNKPDSFEVCLYLKLFNIASLNYER